MQTLNSFSPEEFIPFFAIFFTFMVPILAMYFYYQQKKRVMEERRLMIEKGLTPAPLKEYHEQYQHKSSFSKGINLIAIALGLLVGYFLSRTTNIAPPFSIAGGILFFLGIANVINSFRTENNTIHETKTTNDEKF